jgi:uncharacterized protein YegP (UPF0339 family)
MRSARLELFCDSTRQWRWRLLGANRRKVATSGEAFTSRWHAHRAAWRLVQLISAGVTMPAYTPRRPAKRTAS